MAKAKINMDEMKLSDGIKEEIMTDAELSEVVGGSATMFPPQIPWTCPSCGHYNNTTENGGKGAYIVKFCVICGQPRPKKN